MSIKRDLKNGKDGETIVRDFFTARGFLVNIKQGKFQPYDLEVHHPATGTFTIEVKYDLYSAKSGNLAFEYFNPKQEKPSGILATKADYWCHVLPSKVILITPTELLKRFTKEVKPKKIVTCGGDKNSSMLIYALDVAEEWFSRLVETTTATELMTVLNREPANESAN